MALCEVCAAPLVTLAAEIDILERVGAFRLSVEHLRSACVDASLAARARACSQRVSDAQLRTPGEATTLGGEPSGSLESLDSGEPRRKPITRGTVVGRYVVVDQLGAGAMGVVYEAYDPKLDRKIALKVLSRGPRLRAQAQARLLREAQALGRLSHPNVVAVHDIHEFDGVLAVAMEFIDGMTLRAWGAEKRRSWREVLRVFMDAGRGLHAAHAAGLVHRDFKPDNVMIRRDGRVFVVDLGLAVFFDPTETHDSSASAGTTHTGIAGTPAYMSPEQHEGHVCDPRSDQFSYCATFYELLYGQRAFAGETMASVVEAITSGRVSPPPRDRLVPRWLQRAIMRGLAPTPQQRFPSMVALLAVLDRRPRRVVPLAVGILGLGVGLLAQVLNPRAHDPCSGAAERLDPVWSPAVADTLTEAFDRAARGYVADAGARIVPRLDAYASRWIETHIDNCQATWVRGEQSSALLDLRTGCLERARRHLGATAALLADADAETLTHAHEIIEGLPDLERCSDPEALGQEAHLTPHAAIREVVEALRTRLVHASTWSHARSYTRAEEEVREVLAAARELGYEPLIVEALVELGSVLEDRGRYQQAKAVLSEGGLLAHRLRHDAMAGQAFTHLVRVTGQDRAPLDETITWARLADATAGRTGDLHLLTTVRQHRADALHRAGRELEAELELRMALAIAAHVGAPPTRRGALSNALANVLAAQARPTEARAAYEQALASMTNSLGPRHPEVAAIESNLGDLLSETGDHEAGIAHTNRALAIYEEGLPADHPKLAAVLLNAAAARARFGEVETAATLADRALRVAVAAHGQHHAETASYVAMVGMVAYLQDDLDAAGSALEQAAEILRRTVGADAVELPNILGNLASVERKRGNLAAAVTLYRESLQLRERTFAPDHPALAPSLYGLAIAELELGERERALESFDRALHIRLQHGEDPGLLAENAFYVADLLWTTGRDRVRALDLARTAIELGATDPEVDDAGMQVWLDRRLTP